MRFSATASALLCLLLLLGCKDERDIEERAVDRLIEEWQAAEDPFDQRKAVRALGDTQHPRALGPLMAVFNDETEDAGVRGDAGRALGRIEGPEVVPTLLAAVDHPVLKVRMGAYEALGPTKDPRALNVLTDAVLNHDDYYVRHAAVRGLSLHGSPRAIGALMRIVKNKEEECNLRRHAMLYLKHTRNADWVPCLSAVLADPEDNDFNRGRAFQTLALSMDPKAYSAAIPALEDPKSSVRKFAAEVIATRHFYYHDPQPVKEDYPIYGDPRVVKILTAMAANEEEDPEARAYAQEALDNLKDPADKPQ